MGLEDLDLKLGIDGLGACGVWEVYETPLTLLFTELAKPLLRADGGSEEEVSEEASKLRTVRMVDVT